MTTPTYSFTPTKIILTISVILGVLLLAAATLTLNPNKPIVKPYATEYPVKLSSLTSGCGNYFLFNEDTLDEVKEGKTNVILPVTGSTKEEPLNLEKQFYTTEDKDLPTLDQITSTMYHKNATIIWYADTANKEDIQTAKTYAKDNPKLNIIVMPWTEKTEEGTPVELPLGRQIGITSWAISQSCSTPNTLTYDSYFGFHGQYSWHKQNQLADN